MPITANLKKNDSGTAVKTLQQRLLNLGFALPRFGADGQLGDETLTALGLFLVSRGLRPANDEPPKMVTVSAYQAVEDAAAAGGAAKPSNFFDEIANHAKTGRSVANPFRRWNQITAIVLHQTASKIGEKPASWHQVPIHFGVTIGGKIVQLYEFTETCNHASNGAFNFKTIGIEVDGWYEGIQGKPATLWQPDRRNPTRIGMTLSTTQRDAARSLISWIIKTVQKNGGQITHVHAHRQSSKDRQSDPGSQIWQALGLWTKATHGLADGGPGFTVATGLPIPTDWDPSYTARY